MKSKVKIKGSLYLKTLRKDGVITILLVENTLVNWALISFAGILAGTAWPSVLTHIALGNGTTPVALTDTTLENELGRYAATASQLAPPNDNTAQFQILFDEGDVVGTFNEAGIFSADTGGNMLNRVVFGDFVVGASDTLTVTWLIEFGN